MDNLQNAAGDRHSTGVPQAAVLVIAAYIGAQMIADITSVKIGIVAGLAVDMGTFVYPMTFTLRDLVHKLLGKRNAQVLIVAAAAINLVMVGYTWWASTVPADPSGVPFESYRDVFGPLWRITTASILAEVVSELADTEAYHWFVTRVSGRYQWARVLISNAVSVPLDNIIFAVGAFAPILGLTGGVPWPVVWEIFVFNLLIKFGLTVVSLPLIYLVPDRRRSTGGR